MADLKKKSCTMFGLGFLKEQVKIVAETGRRILRVSGERLIGGNKWIRFLEEVTVSENCEMAGTTAKFEFLRISIPIEMAAAPQIETPVPEIPHPKPQFAPETLEQEEAERGKEIEKQMIGREIPGEELAEGKMLMNVGVATVVIVALGGWISYSSIAASPASISSEIQLHYL